ncbi:hypothetical protein BD413DRAFT_30589 [Trametes elegans]|nr:hypothetical protein BD413DRAFT_30589 [Trametes elegans]
MSCENYGTQNGSSCACPPGFGGPTCSQPACGGTIFQGSSRSLASGSPANLTSCACEDGWTGTGCNVCKTAQACQAGFMSVRGTSGDLTGSNSGQNNTLVCSTTPRVYAAGRDELRGAGELRILRASVQSFASKVGALKRFRTWLPVALVAIVVPKGLRTNGRLDNASLLGN